MKKRSAIILILVLVVSIFATKARAQITTERTFTITPPTVELSLDPGAKKEGTIKLINDSATPLTFNVSMQDFIVKDNAGTPDILPPGTLSNKYSGADWVALYPNVVTIQPHSKAEFQYFVQVPLDARPGGHYAAAIYTPSNTLQISGTGASVNTSVGTLFYVTVNGPVNIKARVISFLTKGFWDFGPVTVNTQIQNNSDIHITPSGTITLTNMLGQKSDTKSLATYNIFPGVSRDYQTKLGKTFMLGLYKANLKATYGPNSAPLVATLSFIVFPWKLAVFVVLMVIALVVGYKYWKGDWKLPRRKKEEPQEPQVNS